MALGIIDEAQTAAAVLGHNFPDSQWYKDAYALAADRRPRSRARRRARWLIQGCVKRSITGGSPE